jgi:hypothetical protein
MNISKEQVKINDVRHVLKRGISGIAIPAPSKAGEIEESSRQLGADSSVIVLEKHVRLMPRLRTEPLDPFAKLFIRVLLAPKPHVAPVGGTDEFRTWRFVDIGDTVCTRMRAKAVENVVEQSTFHFAFVERGRRERPQELTERSEDHSFDRFGDNDAANDPDIMRPRSRRDPENA